MKTIVILRSPDSFTVVLKCEATHPILPCVIRTLTPLADFPLDRPACAEAVAHAFSGALSAPVVWL